VVEGGFRGGGGLSFWVRWWGFSGGLYLPFFLVVWDAVEGGWLGFFFWIPLWVLVNPNRFQFHFFFVSLVVVLGFGVFQGGCCWTRGVATWGLGFMVLGVLGFRGGSVRAVLGGDGVGCGGAFLGSSLFVFLFPFGVGRVWCVFGVVVLVFGFWGGKRVFVWWVVQQVFGGLRGGVGRGGLGLLGG